MKKSKSYINRPTIKELESELDREKKRQSSWKIFHKIVYILVFVAAITVIIATIYFPVLRIYGSSMTPTLRREDIVVTAKNTKFQRKDIVAFYYNNKILVKRVIATEGEWIDLDENGRVSVDGKVLDEPYVLDMAKGECDIELPCQVPEGKIFVMGDHRSVSVDSRSSSVGFIAEEQIVGKLFVRLWPLKNFGKID